MFTSLPVKHRAIVSMVMLAITGLAFHGPLAFGKETSAKNQSASEHPYDGLTGRRFWQAVERDKLSPTQLPGATGSAHHPSPHGPFRHDPALEIPKHAYSPFDQAEVHCPSRGCQYLDNVLLVKLKPRERNILTMAESGNAVAPSALDEFLGQLPIQTMERIFPNAEAPAAGAMVESPSGELIPQPDLTRWHRLVLNTDVNRAEQNRKASADVTTEIDLQQTLRELRTLEEVEYAEPEYLFQTIGDVDSAGAIQALPDSNIQASPSASERFNDPDINRQWHLAASNVPAAWQFLEDQNKSAGGSPDIVVAVIDTGVDYNHPDLINSMWVNPGEFAGSTGQDSDNNGYVDDLHGANVISSVQSGDPLDDHGHGTHVAGIIAAQANNGEGGVGVAPNVKIMAIKAAQYSGVLNASDIARGIEYAIDNGADVINMSFGGYARSQLVEDALANAFGVAVLVAAAGNDGTPNLPCPFGANFYPASYNWVLGVMSRNEFPDEDGDFLSGFSNYDCAARDLQEYELMAPGASIYSTLPFAGYGAWSGTSMATPVVAGIAALARTHWPDKSVYSSRYIMGQLAGASPMIQAYTPDRSPSVFYAGVDALQALTSAPQPELSYLEHWLFDTTDVHSDNNPNGIVDAGETIDLAVVIRNHWGRAENVKVKLEAWAPGAVQPDPWVEMLIDMVDYDAVGSFNKKSNGLSLDEDGVPIGVVAPFRFRTLPDTPNDHVIVFRLTITGQNGYDPSAASVSSESYFYQLVQSGTELPRFIETDMTLDDSRLWLVPNGVLIREGATLTIGPGARVQFFTTDPADPFSESYQPQLQVEGTLDIAGTAEAPVKLFSGLLYQEYPVVIQPVDSGQVTMNHVSVINPVFSDRPFYGNNQINRTLITSISNAEFRQANPYCIRWWRSYEAPGWWGGCESGPAVFAGAIQTSMFRKLGYRFEDFQIEGSVLSELLFDGVYASEFPEGVNSSVFLRNYTFGNRWNPSEPFSASLSTKGIHQKSFLKFGFLEEYEGHTYVAVAGSNQRDNDLLKLVDRFAQMFGGNLAWIENEAENEFVRSFVQTWTETNFSDNFGDMDCGLPNCWALFLEGGGHRALLGMVTNSTSPKKEFRWIGGQPLEFEFWADGYPLNEQTYIHIRTDNGRWASSSSHQYMPSLIKLPGSISRQELFEKREIFMAEHRYGLSADNAFLNDWFYMSPEYWMRFLMESGPDYVATIANNFWGTQSSALIDAALIDANDNFNLGELHYEPILTEAPESAYPFVADIEISNSAGITSQVGAEPISFSVRFNRDMDTDIQPLVSFGPDTPYTDFLISGEWANSQTWVGEFTTTPMTGDGWQYMRVTGAVAADNPWLVTGDDYRRFRFEIVTSGTEAMSLQASGEEGRIRLWWSQNDFDTLAGYNLYRAPVGSSAYQRINASVIPQGMTTWEDQSVEPGQPYQYYFTVVRTDLTESGPSNFAQATALDTVPPVITHSPISTAGVGLPLTIRATVTDNVSVEQVRLFFRAIGESSWQERPMILVNERYSVTLEGGLMQAPGLEYFLRASDGRNETNSTLMSDPHRIAIDDVPVITTISPTVGPASGGIEVTISGSNFMDGASVTIGDAFCSIVSVTRTSIRCVTNAHIPERVQVTVTNPSNEQGVLPNAFTYQSEAADMSLPQTTVPKSQNVAIPLSLANVVGLVSAQWTVSYDPSVLDPTDVAVGNLSYGWFIDANTSVEGQITVSMVSNSGSVTGDGIMATLAFDVIGEHGASSVLNISEVMLNDGAIPVTTGHGEVTIESVYGISGKVVYWNEQRSVANVEVMMGNALGNSMRQVSKTSETGDYEVFAPAGNYSLTMHHPGGAQNISAFDAALVLSHSSGNTLLTGSSLVAADVNRSGVANAHDAFLILQYAAGLSDLPFQNAGQVWLFDPEMRSFSDLDTDQTQQNFTGVLLGDSSGNWNEQATHSSQRLSGLNEAVTFSLSEDSGELGDQLTSVFSLSTTPSAFQAIELDFKYNPELFDVVNVKMLDGIEGWMMTVNSSQPGKIRVVAAGAEPISDARDLLALDFQVRTAGNHSSIWSLDTVEIDEGRLSAEPISSALHIILSDSIFHDDFSSRP